MTELKGIRFNPMFSALAVLFSLVFAAPASAARQLDPVVLKNAVDASARAEGKKLGDYALVDQDGAAFSLSEYFGGGKPLVLSYIYTACAQVCPAITMELKGAVDGAREKFGDRFEVLTIGFDAANDTPEAMREYGARFTAGFDGFRFAAGDRETIERLLAEVGFFNFRQDDGSFDHMDMVTVVRPDGTVYKQVYSLRTQPRNLGLRLDELITGKAEGGATLTLVDKLKFFCYRYDPYTGKYVLDYPVFVSIFLQALLIGIIVYAVWGGAIRKRLSRKGSPE